VSRLLPGDPSVANLLLLAATETSTDQGMDSLIVGLKEVL
jgi:glycine dehydrogenase subunit 1